MPPNGSYKFDPVLQPNDRGLGANTMSEDLVQDRILVQIGIVVSIFIAASQQQYPAQQLLKGILELIGLTPASRHVGTISSPKMPYTIAP